MKKILPLVLTSIVVLAACNEKDPAGICIHKYETPIVELRVKDDATPTPPTEVFVNAIKIDGRDVAPADVPDLVNASVINTVTGPWIRCTLPCQFGTQAGLWEFVIDVPGRANFGIHQNVAYTSFRGGCPSSSSGPTIVTISFGASPTRRRL